MTRNMSFALMIEQFENKTKTVMRRFGWDFLKPGDIVYGVEKVMGLKRGEKIKNIGLIRIVLISKEPLDKISKNDCAKEGFPHFYQDEFVQMICHAYGCSKSALINRIEFEYIS